MSNNLTRWCLGIDTSDSSTSVAGFEIPKYESNQDLNIGNGALFAIDNILKHNIPAHFSARLPFTLEKGEKLPRQNEAAVMHMKALPTLISELVEKFRCTPSAVVTTDRFRDSDDSLPCFIAGQSVGESISATLGVPYFNISHLSANIYSAVIGANRMDLLKQPHYLCYACDA